MNEAFLEQFQSPSNRFRPKMRWWLPGAFMDNQEIKREIRAMAEAGYGGAEVCYFFGIPTADVEPSDYGKYYFGSAEWNDRMKAALERAIEYDFQLDFTVGPLWPIATPAITDKDDERCMQGLHIGEATFTGTFQGSIPIPETIVSDRAYRLVAVTAARKLSEGSVGKVATYDLQTVMDLMSLSGVVNRETRSISFSAPDLGEWSIFGFWSQTNGQMNDSALAPAIDHFARAPIDAVIGNWDRMLLGDPELAELYRNNGGCIFCDSIELNATMLGGMYGAAPKTVAIWTPELLNEFRSRRGYDLTPYLPSIFIKGLYQMGTGATTDGDSDYDFQDRELNHRIRNDFFITLTEMFRDNHIRALRTWANGHGMKLRYQTYGLTTELTSGVVELDVPETETLGFADSIDGYRYQSGAVHMSGKEIYSLELGAVMGMAYRQSWTNGEHGLLRQFHRSLMAGVNQAILHGMSYETTSAVGQMGDFFKWPGLSLMATMFSNEWGERQPIWLHSSDLTGYMSRLQMVLRQGKPKVDLGVYRYSYDGLVHGLTLEPTILEKAGYSYDYISPCLLELEGATIGVFDRSPVLAAEGPAYKAIVVEEQIRNETGESVGPFMPVETARKLAAYAEAGLPILIVGQSPWRTLSFKSGTEELAQEDKELIQILNGMMKLSNVLLVANKEEIPQSLERVGIMPAAYTGKPGLLCVRRYDEEKEFFLLYNSSLTEAIEASVSFRSTGVPYFMNTWNGEIVPVCGAEVMGDRTSIPIRLAANATTVIGFSNQPIPGREAKRLGRASTELQSMEITDWDLHIESWTAGDRPTKTKKERISFKLNKLLPWFEMEGLESASGVGTYTTRIVIDEEMSTSPSVCLSLGEVSDTYRVQVNGVQIPTGDQISKQINLSGFLISGSNFLEIEVATTLNNALRVTDETKPIEAYGLLGPVTLSW